MNVVTGNKLQNRPEMTRRGRGYRALSRPQLVSLQPSCAFGKIIPLATPIQKMLPIINQGSAKYKDNVPGSSALGRKRQPGSGRNGSAENKTPRSGLTSTTDGSSNSACIVALSEGRGHARGEVGIAALDTTYPHLILCQISDSQEYNNTMRKLNVFNPVEIIVPNTFCMGPEPNNLYKCVQSTFPSVTITSVLRRHFSDTRGLQQIRHLCASDYSSVAIVVSQKFYALAAAAALIKYVEFSLNMLFSPKSLRVEYQGSQNTMVIDIKTAHLLELTQSIRDSASHYCLMGILNRCYTHGGVRLLRANILEPPCLLEKIVSRLNCVQELVETPELLQTLESILPKFSDVDQLLSLCMHVPQQDNIQVAEYQMKYALLLKSILEVLPGMTLALQDCKSEFLCSGRESLSDERFEKIKGKILSIIHQDARTAKGASASEMQRNFAVKAGVNEFLDLARQSYCEIVSSISDLVSKLAETYQLPLKVKFSGNWGYHIELSIGKKRFTETDLPSIFVQVHKNRNTFSFTTQDLILADIRSKEAMKEITKLSNIVICGLLSDIRSDIGCIFKLCEIISELDMLTSFANLSSLTSYVRPQFGRTLCLEQSRHPILDSVLQQVPISNDVFSSVDFNCHIITGPNMSGKSIYIRQIALLQILAQIGCYVPAESAIFRITDHIFSRLGYDDSIECNASTFVLELKEFQYIKQMMTPTSLIIVDELCRGTSCEEGTAVALAIVEHLLQKSAFIFIATHFLYLTKLQETYNNVVNHHFEALEESTESGRERLIYTHKLLQGVTQLEHYGLRLAEGLAFPETILKNAKALAKKISTERKAFGSSNVNIKPENTYYNLASLAIELNLEGNLNPQKVKELQDMFCHLRDEAKLESNEIDIVLDKKSLESVNAENNDGDDDNDDADDDVALDTTFSQQQNDEEENPLPLDIHNDIISQERVQTEKCKDNAVGDKIKEKLYEERENLDSGDQKDINSEMPSQESNIIGTSQKSVGKDNENIFGSSIKSLNAPYESQYCNVEEEPMDIEQADDRLIHQPSLFSFPDETSENGAFHTILETLNEYHPFDNKLC